MKTRHYPVEDANTDTTWIYNPDDSVQQTIDPRGALTNFTYNQLRLATQISYDPPANHPEIPDATTVSFSYDAVGNRTQMSDGTGTTEYFYDPLSRLESEKKYFNLLPDAPVPDHKYSLSYEYSIGGGLKSVTDPFGYTINYTDDKSGRITAVSGDPTADNPTGQWANGIQYRAFGQIKQMTYAIPDAAPTIKLEYDNRLRADYWEIARSGGFEAKADFTHGNDSRVIAKNDLLDDKWDRSMKYDFAGRLTHNQFGMGQSNNNGNVRVYEQAIEYDGFSMMAEREVTNWGQTGGFGESYVNGRIQSSLVDYDASGNVVSQPIDSMPEGTGTNTFDAAGRRVKYFDQRFGRFNGYLNMVQEHVTAYDFDGDGRPVVEKDNWRTYPRNDPPSGVLEATPKVFQIWSSVLGSSLVTIGGYTGGTKVFAGGTLIGTANANAGSRWATADPVIGTTVRWAGSNGVWEKAAEETEPLGQLVASVDPDTENDPGYDFAARNSAFPQWQCDLPDDVRPMECRIREEIESSLNGTSIKSIWDPNKKDGDPSFIHVNDPPPDSARDMPGTVTHQATHSTAKPIDQTADGATTVPTQNPDNCDGDVDLENNKVNIRCGDSTIPEDFKDASYSPLLDIVPKSIDDHDPNLGKVALSGKKLGKYENGRSKLRKKLAESAKCRNFLLSKGIDPDDLLETVNKQIAWDGELSTISRLNAGLIDSTVDLSKPENASYANGPVQNNFIPNRGTIYLAWTAFYSRYQIMELDWMGRREVYFGKKGLNSGTILHEAIHSMTGMGDPELANLLGVKIRPGEDTHSITKILRKNDCAD
ncbi:MAG: RHS repeat protein [Acidobacteria bacterium]|nr:RHS repeat protein [Acidobacteriota bacterium]